MEDCEVGFYEVGLDLQNEDLQRSCEHICTIPTFTPISMRSYKPQI